MTSKQCVFAVSNLKSQNLDSSSLSNCCQKCLQDDILKSDRSDVGSRSSANHRPGSRSVSLQNSILSSHHAANGYICHEKHTRHKPHISCGHAHGALSDRSHGALSDRSHVALSDRSHHSHDSRTNDSITDLKNLHIDLSPDGLTDLKPTEFTLNNISPRKCDVSSEANPSESSVYKSIINVISKTLLTLCLICIACLIMSLLAFQLLMSLSQPLAKPPASSLVYSNSDLLEVTVAIVTLVLTLDLGCLVVCSMQCFYVAKILQLPDGDYRSVIYLKQCAGSRFIAVLSFFASIPTFFIALLLYIVMRFNTTPAIISMVILGAGLLLCVITSVYNTYQWRVAKNCADKDRVATSRGISRKAKLSSLNHFSTLV